MTMQRVPINDAQNEFHFVMNQVCGGLGPVLITGIHGNAVLVSEAEWRRIQKLSARADESTQPDVARESIGAPVGVEPTEDRV